MSSCGVVRPDEVAGKTLPVQPQSDLVFITRQPILDRLGRVHAYCLLTRTPVGTVANEHRNHATRGLIDNTLLFGIDQITQGSSAFIPCTPETLEDGLTEMLPPSLTVLLLQPGPEAIDPDLPRTCARLKSAGFRFSMAGSDAAILPEPLLELMDYVKVDFSSTTRAERQLLLEQALTMATAPIAEKVETETDYCQASREGFGLFHGYYFCRPELFRKQSVPANRLAHLKILQLLQQNVFDMAEVARWVRNDTSLTYRLLRLVNSPACAIRQDVRSIETALMILGEKTFRRMALLAVSSELNAGNSVEVLRMAFLRSWFCEQMATPARLDPAEQHLLGMLSLLPAMLGRPMAELISGLPLRDQVRAALTGTHNPERTLLSWLEAYEAGDWNTATTLASTAGVPMQRMVSTFLEAILHAEELLRLAV